MRTAIGRMIRLLTARDRRRLLLVLCGMIVAAFASTAGVASIMPFLTLVGDPGAVQDNTILSWLYKALGFTSDSAFLVAIGLFVLAVLVCSNATIALVNWGVFRFIWMRNHALSKRLLSSYMHRPYVFFLGQNTSTLGRNILTEVQNAVNGVLLPGMRIMANLLISLTIFGFLVLVDPLIATTAAGVLSILYGVFYFLVRRYLRRLGHERVEANRLRFKIADEAFGTMKTVKTLGVESYFTDRYSQPSFRFGDRAARGAVIGLMPRYVLETLAFGGILVIVLALIAREQDVRQILPLLGVYAFAGYRMLPAIQSVFAGLAKMRFSEASLAILESDLRETERVPGAHVPSKSTQSKTLTTSLELRSVSFRYPGASEPAVRNISLEVIAGSSVAIVGPTGSGKTTVVDLILGLLQPETGRILFDGQAQSPMEHHRWSYRLGYVPQEIYLQDDSVVRNIAFGASDDEIHMAAVERAARIAQIHEFILRELSEGYETVVGERGVRLSGGERQRIGIARALYHNPSVLILDEATSALDGGTEDRVYRALREQGDDITMITIAHRLATVQDCDVIYVIDQGQIVALGRYEELLSTCELFRVMVTRDGA